MLSVSHFEKKYGDTVVLKIDQIAFERGIHWIKGENGSGKTTLFRSISGLIPSSGEVTFSDGITLKKNPVEFRKRISYSEAEPLYPGFLTGKELFAFVQKSRKVSKENTAYYRNLFGIEEYYHKSCDTYSSGMSKKLSLSLSFIGNPDIIILDEPFITLDNQASQLLINEIKKGVTEENKVFLISSHQLIGNDLSELINCYTIQNKKLILN